MRPAIVISNDVSNRNLSRVQVVPITSNTSKLFPTESYITLKGQLRKATADQLTTASKERFGDFIQELTEAEIYALEQAIRLQLGLAE